MKFKGITIHFAAMLLLSIAIVTGCKREFDEPPAEGTIDIQSNLTIAELKSKHTLGAYEKLDQDWIIEGVVIADDQSGNYYKTIVIQDATGGIDVKLNANSLFNNYPIGRKIYIKVNGLYLGDYNGLIQLGGGTYNDTNGNPRLAGIEELLIPNFVLKGARNQAVTPKVTTIDQLTDADVSTLVILNAVQFAAQDTAQPYADAINKLTVNRNVEDCNGGAIILRNSGYADFANQLMPGGNGTITAVYSIFGSDKQLYIRNTDDVVMHDARCNSGCGGAGDYLQVGAIRSMFTGTITAIPDAKRVKGTVLSDGANANLSSKNMYLLGEDGKGIAVRFTANHSFVLGEQVDINISGVELSEFNGLLQLNNVPLSNACSIGTGTLPTPPVMTIADLNNNFENLEATLVRIPNVLITKSSGNTYTGNATLNDGTGTLVLYTTSYASFAGTAFPTDTVTITGIVSQGGTNLDKQLIIRNTNDVVVTGGGGGPTGDINETFDGVADGADAALPGWLNVAVTGTRLWRGKVYTTNHYLQATAYNDTNTDMEAWLITPPIDLSTPKKLNFDSEKAFWVHDGMSVWISTNFDGSNIQAATWTQLPATIVGQADADNVWINSTDISLSGYTGTGYIAFKYVGNNTTGTTSYRLDNVKVLAQ